MKLNVVIYYGLKDFFDVCHLDVFLNINKMQIFSVEHIQFIVKNTIKALNVFLTINWMCSTKKNLHFIYKELLFNGFSCLFTLLVKYNFSKSNCVFAVFTYSVLEGISGKE